MSPLGFKARMGSHIRAWQRHTCEVELLLYKVELLLYKVELLLYRSRINGQSCLFDDQ